MYLNTFFCRQNSYILSAYCRRQDAKKCLDQWYELAQGNSQTVPVVNTLPVSGHLDYNCCIFLYLWFFFYYFNLLFLNIKKENDASSFLAVLYWSTVTPLSTRSLSYAFCSSRMFWMKWEDCGLSLILLHPELSPAWQFNTAWTAKHHFSVNTSLLSI